jgi:glucose uptake protein GlcU
MISSLFINRTMHAFVHIRTVIIPQPISITHSLVQYCKRKSQIKQKEYSGMTHHGLIFTGTTPIGNIRICSSTMVVGITTTYAISTYHVCIMYAYVCFLCALLICFIVPLCLIVPLFNLSVNKLYVLLVYMSYSRTYAI